MGSELIDNAEQEPIGKCMLGMTTGRSGAEVLIGVVLLMAACTKVPPEATAVADQFIRAYFVEDNVAAAAKLTSGAAKSRLDGVLRQIEATGLKEPAKDKPRVKVTPVETQSVSADVIGYVYRIDFGDTRYSADHRETAAQQERQYLERERIRAESMTPRKGTGTARQVGRVGARSGVGNRGLQLEAVPSTVAMQIPTA